MKMTWFIIAILAVFIIGCTHKEKEVKPVKTGLEGEKIPSMNLLLTKNRTYWNTTETPVGKSTIMFYFSPTCPHCRVQMRHIVNNMEKFQDVQFTLLTNANYDETKNFYDRYKLGKYPNMITGIDTGYVFAKYFKTTWVPLLAIYDKDRSLRKVYVGEVGINELLNSVKNTNKNIAQSINKP